MSCQQRNRSLDNHILTTLAIGANLKKQRPGQRSIYTYRYIRANYGFLKCQLSGNILSYLHNKRRNIHIMQELGIQRDVAHVIQLRRLTCFVHVVRMDSVRLPRITLHRRTSGHRRPGRPNNNNQFYSSELEHKTNRKKSH